MHTPDHWNLVKFQNGISSANNSPGLLTAAIALVAVGMLFKVGAVPFHQWVPDVYMGSPTPVTSFMAGAVKVAAFGGLLRVFYVAFGALVWGLAAINLGCCRLNNGCRKRYCISSIRF
jgi:NADH-quinone oxidoreductase subunit N